MNKRFAPLPAELVDKWRGETRRTRDVLRESGELFASTRAIYSPMRKRCACGCAKSCRAQSYPS